MKEITWRSPSNIAFIKYWGKHGTQLPRNTSLSMTLAKCFTETHLRLKNKKGEKEIDVTFKFEGKENPAFSERISKYLTALSDRFSFIHNFALEINSKNSFPHSAGIASSASSMSALSLCLLSAEQKLGRQNTGDFYVKASEIARLGSGSASRSLYKEYAIWGKHDKVPGSSDNYAIGLNQPVNNVFKCLNDTILIIDSKQKKVSSSIGHSLMNNHPYAQTRFENANQNLGNLLQVLEEGNFETFSFILEHEALSLHSMMLTAKPWYSLLIPNTLVAIQKIKEFRDATGAKITFTLDAGPNVHVIYPDEEIQRIKPFIEGELKALCQDGAYIDDNIGNGPELLFDSL